MNTTLTSSELAALRDKLEGIRTRLLAQIQVVTAARADSQDAMLADGRAAEDLAEASMERAQMELMAIEERDMRFRLAEVQHALHKFAHGTYGLCESCGQPIPLMRLKILPEARFDATHQAEMEMRLRASTRVAVAAGEA